MYYGKSFSDEDMARALAAGECPRCRRPAQDMRGVGFSADAMRARRECFWFGKGTFECNAQLVIPTTVGIAEPGRG